MKPSPAISGYDPVAYFEEGSARRGSPDHSIERDGRTWHFLSGRNAEAFSADPERYAPAYDGHCAFAASLGKRETGDPRRWAIRDGRLFLNSNGVAHILWKLLPGRIAAADRQWSSTEGSVDQA